MKRFFLIVCSILTFSSISAQETADIGIWGGVGSYLGDMTQIDQASSLNPNVGVFFRYNFNSRLSLRTSLMAGTIGATGKYEADPWEFDKFMTDVSVMGEFNFFRYIIGSKRHSMTTYLMSGLGTSLYKYTYDPALLSPMVYYLNNEQLGIVPAEIHDELILEKEESIIGLNVPIGFGFKFNIGERMGIGIEAILRKYFNDKVDDLDDPRKFYSLTDGPNGSSQGAWKSYNTFLHNNDFTYHLGIHLTYRFYRGDQECPVYENIK
ncbi:DUF6089 family protein [uncultured Sunxiuqinia sp.]|uniref:DUF6089 family protein n=1 Tax=Sunxiuqinia rutila TaxID=1397841 RepID=UPI00262F89C8|nr:DUF6089 family protein [uncultured Sunxiuqinia sp.]